MLRIHAGDICTHHACVSNGLAFCQLTWLSLIFFVLFSERAVGASASVLLLLQNAIGPLNKVACCPLHTLRLSFIPVTKLCAVAISIPLVHKYLERGDVRSKVLSKTQPLQSILALLGLASDGRFYGHILFNSFHRDDHICVKCTVRLGKPSKYFPQGLVSGPPVGFTNYIKSSVSCPQWFPPIASCACRNLE